MTTLEATNVGSNYSLSCLNWGLTSLHTINSFIIILMVICAVNLFFSLKRAHGKFAMVIILWFLGLMCLGIANWTTMAKFGTSLFTEGGNVLVLAGLIFMAQFL